MEKPENLNRKDHLKVVPRNPLENISLDLPRKHAVAPDPPLEKTEEIWNEVLISMERYFNTNSPRLVGFGFAAKCELLGANDWMSIIGPVKEKYTEFHDWSCSEIVKHLHIHTRDPQADQIYYRLKQYFL
ncbi:MAG: hypothetical protein NT009_05430 [Proteobacteria bacterium]|jgi:hypothetical protein|nr:hypothetical protein [Pseudomonadota bacterium]